jgi:hypothetical protein
MNPETGKFRHIGILYTGLFAWITVVLGRSFFIWFDWETVRFFVQPRPCQYRWLSPWWTGWVDLSDYGIDAASQTLRPLMTWTFQIESLLFGDCASGYHLLNFTAHLCCVCLIIRFLNKHRVHPYLSILSGLLFALHPLNTQPLWILVDRAEVFVLLGGLIALNWYPSRQWTVLAGMFTALYSKETAITILLWLLAYDLLFLDRQKPYAASVKNRVRRLLPASIITIVYVLHRTLAFTGAGGYRSVDHMQLDHFFDVFSQNISWLLTLPHGNRHITFVIIVTIPLLAILCKSRLSVFGIIWFVLFLLPTHNLCNKWYLYAAVAAFVTIWAGICHRLMSVKYLQKPVSVCLLIIAGWFSFTSYAELKHQQRNAAVPVFLSEQLKTIKPDLPANAEVRFVFPAYLDPYGLKGHYFDPGIFQVKTYKSPIESIVWDLNATRYLQDSTPVWTRSVEAAVRLAYDDIGLRVILTRTIEIEDSRIINVFYHPKKGVELIEPSHVERICFFERTPDHPPGCTPVKMGKP